MLEFKNILFKNNKKEKKLIIYFSRTGENYFNDGDIRNLEKGNTEILAETLAKTINADLFKVEPLNEYPVSYRECCIIAKTERRQAARPELKNYLKNIDDYGTIYLCYPIWWNDLPMPMYTQMDKLNFKNKKVIAIATHEGSVFGNSIWRLNTYFKDIKGVEFSQGFAIAGSELDKCQEKINEWLSTQ